MDKEWLQYWKEIENLETDNNENDKNVDIIEKEKNKPLKEAKDLYKSVLTDDN